MELLQVNKSVYTEGGIRTHEAVAVELKSTPFDRSGTSAMVNKYIIYIKQFY